jgi:Outer membrane protein beta-barrel domain
MKRIYFLATLCAIATASYAQQPTTGDSTVSKKRQNDTISIGSILIIKRNDKSYRNDSSTVLLTDNNYKKKNSKISTNFLVLDLGFANWEDKSNYAAAGSFLVNKPGALALSKDDLKLRAGKSVNVNIWFFMQKLALVKRNINLKYGLGVELNNYSFRSPISFREGGAVPYNAPSFTNAPFIFRDSISFSKNKLALKYITVPLMLNFASNHKPGKAGFSASVGVSAGYLYKQRNKQRSDTRGKQKNQGDYDLERFKFSYIGEIGFGSFRLYGSYSPKSIFEKSLDIRPYNVGFRFSKW